MQHVFTPQGKLAGGRDQHVAGVVTQGVAILIRISIRTECRMSHRGYGSGPSRETLGPSHRESGHSQETLKTNFSRFKFKTAHQHTSDEQPMIANLLFCLEVSRLRKVPFMRGFTKLHNFIFYFYGTRFFFIYN